MENKKIGCSAGKTILIDPNTFDNQSSSSNVSVPLEDLTISVQLETTKRSRTVLSSDKDLSTSTKGTKIKFIEGREINGQKYLTTSYTDLTTSFDLDNIDDSLGITSINIDFNSSYAPLIVIDFVDLKGSSIFQNESRIKSGKNKYASFFQLPYPIFTLTVKGYYGMPVKYELHMTNFSAKFNSKTNNFEITCKFIGYTYAMLSDMLLGYLKAIPYTELGRNKYNKIKETQPDLLTLDELMDKISKIDTETKKLKSTDEDVAQLTNGKDKQDNLIAISSNLLELGREIDIKNDLNEYKFIIVKKNIYLTKPFDSYNRNVKENIDKYNTLNDIKINLNDFNIKNKYEGLSLRLLSPLIDIDETFESNKKNNLKNIVGGNQSPDELDRTIRELYAYAKKYVPSDSYFDVYDLRSQYKILKEKDVLITNELKNLRKSLGNKLRTKVRDVLGLDPSVRNIINVFTSSVEVLMSVLFDVSATAIGGDKDIREAQLKKFSPDSNKTQETSLNDIKFDGIFYPWPEYSINDEVNGPVDTYLGSPGILDVPEDVTEIRFIDDLLNAFLTSKKKTEEAEIIAQQGETNWYPINPLDTRLFVDLFPYARLKNTNKKDIINLLLLRGFTYLGYSNVGLTTVEIQNIANAEVDSLLLTLTDENSIQSLTQLKDSDFYNAMAINDGNEFPLIKPFKTQNGDFYYYNYIFGALPNTPNYLTSSQSDAETQHLIPINKPFNGDFVIGVNETKEKSDDGYLFLTNYKASEYLNNSGSIISKKDDGGVYIKIIKPYVYDGSDVKPLPSLNDSNDNILNLDSLKKGQLDFNINFSDVGFNQFGGKYGIQEYRNLNFGESGLENIPYRLLFFKTDGLTKKQLVKNSGLASKRKEGVSTPYDITSSTYSIAERFGLDINSFVDSAFDNVIENIGGSNAVHENYGNNVKLLNDYIVNKSQNVSYPYVFFQVAVDIDDANYGNSDDSTPVSLFGSRLYYEQTIEASKALLFLHTFPWNGFLSSDKEEANGIFNVNEILNSFGNRSGFISVPRLWAAFIGGLLWRVDRSLPEMYPGTNIQFAGGSGPNDPILFKNLTESFIPTYNINSATPTREEYITSHFDSDFQSAPMMFPSDRFYVLNNRGYKHLEDLILSMPDQAKNEFKRIFFEFVAINDGTKSDWELIKSQSQVFNGSGSDWKNAFDQIMTPITSGGGLINGLSINPSQLNTTFVESKLNAVNNGKLVFRDYIMFTPYYGESDFDYNFVLELKDNSDAVKTMLKLISEELIIANMSPLIWQQTPNPNGVSQNRTGIYTTTESLKTYIDSIINRLKPIEGNPVQNKKKQREQDIFGTDNENIIKFQLYRTCKNIYDKWIGGSESSETIIFKNGELNRNSLDKELAKKQGRENNLALIDSFRFVNRSFRDIGDDMIINPTPVGDYLRSNPNSSFYDAVTQLLSSNNFDFIALPTYINYGEAETLESIFKPIPRSTETLSNGVVGPSFVCVYVGQTSKHLDFNDSEYKSDGVTFECDSNGNLMVTSAKDFTNNAEDYENKVAVFSVNFSQQNQNIFKDLILDQNEFSETAESLQITDDIASKGGENRKTFGGQNMYNVYSVRSYKVGVEMMGNAMIQPMMYFQLNNVPMFHGAYMITHVTHSIKPNNMLTNFTGVRIRNIETPMMNVSELFMSLLDSIESTTNPEIKENFGNTGTTESTLTDSDVVKGGIVSNIKNNYSIGCKAPGSNFKQLNYYTKENIGGPIISTKITYSNLIKYLKNSNLSTVEKRVVYSVAILEQGKSDNSFNAFGNNLFGFNVEDNFPGTKEAVSDGKIINVFCYGDSEQPRVFPQFSTWSDSVQLFSNHIVKPRFIEGSRKDGYWKDVHPSLNFYQNGIKLTDNIETQALKFTVLYFMEWNSPSYKVDLVNSIGSASNPTYLTTYKDPSTGNKRYIKHTYDVYKSACSIF